MRVTVSKWANSLAIRIPTNVVDALGIKNGDSISYEIKEGSLILKKDQSTRDIFESFYGKTYDEITSEDLGPGGELNWGEDVGGELF